MSGQVHRLEPWLTKKELAAELRCGVRWVEYRMAEGMPHHTLAGRVVFRRSEVEAWLIAEGHLVQHGEAA